MNYTMPILTPMDESRMRQDEADAATPFRLSSDNSFRAFEEYEARSWAEAEQR